MLRRAYRLLGSTNRYTDGSGRALESNVVPRDLYLQSISNRAYPVQGENWQPVVAGKPSPHKGNVIISGAGVVGLTMAAQFALRGWHTTVVERSPPLCDVKDQPLRNSVSEKEKDKLQKDEAEESFRGVASGASSGEFVQRLSSSSWNQALPPYRGPLVRPHFGSTPEPPQSHPPSKNDESSDPTGAAPSPSHYPPFIELEYALLTRRALDALEAAGVRLSALRHLGVKVRGVMDHPGAYNSWLTAGLTEHHPFAVTMLSIDLFLLRRLLEDHGQHGLPAANLQVFYRHVVEAVYPLRQQLVVRTWAGSAAAKEMQDHAAAQAAASSPVEAERTAAIVAQARQHTPRKHTSLTLSARQWEKKFAEEAVDYDLLVSAEGVSSHLRSLVDVEGFLADVDMGVRWCLLRSSELSHEHIHRWLHCRRTTAITTAQSYHVQSAAQVPVALAFPRVEGSNLFSVMVYAPMGELTGLEDAALLRRYLPDLHHNSPSPSASNATLPPSELVSFSSVARPYPTVYCEQLHNSVGLPSAVLVGDAAHTCNPFWMQSLALGLEDGANLLNQVDAYSRHFYDAVKQYSDERGTNGDALRELTDKCLYYQRKKHANPFVRFQNAYQRWMNLCLPRGWNTLYEGSVNHIYSRSIEEMLNSRGYTSYDYAEKQQAKHRLFYHLGRVYT
ncbi:putative mitochondrial flavoprotein monooxygenase [Leptomonas pyrrhocoris]|uniref:Putative mitochondrial flavoprotein monooxygenase n=1 Tax=Leptomonas pyrrhocoris TaxID=157538 RepID=A0A0N0VDB0_LEPPY|nr:putative mitochondrial flavoprotein monooxygenase [Leptomonas pyrrhocoris]KPA75152.1 putative mitochondrial flavoprotein monooxygenase [Leptomonas pyrrhocoris]|eukprot:XP_015653591.1 putative mitochondrial flavoprotein monooxygenase [Leptomonas pyrrhocoris]